MNKADPEESASFYVLNYDRTIYQTFIYIPMPGIPPIPPIPPPGGIAGIPLSCSGLSAITTSVVRSSAAIEDAF